MLTELEGIQLLLMLVSFTGAAFIGLLLAVLYRLSVLGRAMEELRRQVSELLEASSSSEEPTKPG